jgi:hypothetical protein
LPELKLGPTYLMDEVAGSAVPGEIGMKTHRLAAAKLETERIETASALAIAAGT